MSHEPPYNPSNYYAKPADASGNDVAPGRRSVRWFEFMPDRLLIEKQVMGTKFPQFQLFLIDDCLRWIGDLQTNRGNTYKIEVRYPDEFPYKAPMVYPMEPVIEAYEVNSTERFKHQYPDTHLCLYYPGDKTFSPKTTAAAVVAVAAAWLFAYETWLENGRTYWPGQEAPEMQL